MCDACKNMTKAARIPLTPDLRRACREARSKSAPRWLRKVVTPGAMSEAQRLAELGKQARRIKPPEHGYPFKREDIVWLAAV